MKARLRDARAAMLRVTATTDVAMSIRDQRVVALLETAVAENSRLAALLEQQVADLEQSLVPLLARP